MCGLGFGGHGKGTQPSSSVARAATETNAKAVPFARSTRHTWPATSPPSPSTQFVIFGYDAWFMQQCAVCMCFTVLCVCVQEIDIRASVTAQIRLSRSLTDFAIGYKATGATEISEFVRAAAIQAGQLANGPFLLVDVEERIGEATVDFIEPGCVCAHPTSCSPEASRCLDLPLPSFMSLCLLYF